jgi:hypothetical protein
MQKDQFSTARCEDDTRPLAALGNCGGLGDPWSCRDRTDALGQCFSTSDTYDAHICLTILVTYMSLYALVPLGLFWSRKVLDRKSA